MSLVSILDRTLARSLILFTLFVSAAVRAEPVEVLASIKPLALIASELVAPDDHVSVLLPPGVSPHAYAMRVSDRRALDEADIVVWVGPELESFLDKLMQSKGRQSLAASSVAHLHWPVAASQHSHAHEHDHGHSHSRDMHVWLDPQNALAIALELAERFAQQRPAKADYYRERAAAFNDQVKALDQTLAAQLAPVKQAGFAVYHDGYGHFVGRYGLNQVDFVSVTPEQRPGARHLYHLQKHLPQAAICLMVEPYADTGAITEMAEQLGLKVATLDPLASAAELTSYSALMLAMGETFSTCLSAH